jgi:hypothetical protein
MLFRSHRRLGGWLCVVVLLSGCGGLQEVWEDPGAKTFRPHAIAVLPPRASLHEIAREEVQEVLAGVLRKSSRFERVVPPETVMDTFQASKVAFDALVVYFSRLEMTGHSDRDAAVSLGRALNVDSFLVVRIDSWDYARGVGLNLRLVDATTGATMWKARHERSARYILFKPNLKDVALEVAEEMINAMPPREKR